MVLGTSSLLLTTVLAWITPLSEAVGPVIRCEPCDVGARLLCKPIPKDCKEIVREPGCGCCLTCALNQGQPCGVYTGRCGLGLSCQLQPGETKPLQALLEGRGLCTNVTNRRASTTPTADNQEKVNAGGLEEGGINNTSSVQVPAGRQPWVDLSRFTAQRHTLYQNHAKAELIQRELAKKAQSFKMEEVPSVTGPDQQNCSFETKLEPEYGPCRREMESVLNGLKISDILNPKGFRIPNCDKKGFYKKKQCRPSKGRKRGFCWCVDKYGQPLPGLNGKERGDAQCYNLDNQ
ncbi:insulin-like growth factor-binding protein 3 [Chanos chanos]|uniref:Insulin-like growth factor-binding protein 3 n=1 Tax=Chanos chanos TaxID=29144 RepID=A0A6J2VDP2_CHACN|nr:insulin-like growth factor-binding protein 3 [Chanos chanos]